MTTKPDLLWIAARLVSAGRLGVWFGLAALASGCHQGLIHRAADLPAQFSASPLQSARSLNLSRLANPSGSVETIQPGDVLSVTIATGVEDQEPAQWDLRVSEIDGQINVPLVGSVSVAGLQLTEAELLVRDESVRREVYRRPHVALAFQSRKSNRVIVIGAVADPGVKELPVAASQLVDALVAAGGLVDDASTVVEVRYPPSATALADRSPAATAGVVPARHDAAAEPAGPVQIDLAQLEFSGAESFALPNGAVLNVQRRPKPTVSVLGLVQRPGQYELPMDTDVRLLDGLALAGGRTMEIADRVRIIRSVPGRSDPVVVAASVREAKRDPQANIRLAKGDIISVEETPLTFTVETMRNFVGLGFTSPIPGL